MQQAFPFQLEPGELDQGDGKGLMVQFSRSMTADPSSGMSQYVTSYPLRPKSGTP